MTLGGTRSLEHTRQVGRCNGCGETRIGVTRVEGRPWEDDSKTFHICDGCRGSIVERPLEAVLADFEPLP